MICPVCNGMASLAASCPDCGSPAEDEGRPEDWTGPYSPYELTPRAAAELGLGHPFCPHDARCPECRSVFRVEVGGWHL